MKTFLPFLLSVILIPVISTKAQMNSKENTIEINDIRPWGIMKFDTSAVGHQSYEVTVVRGFKTQNLGLDTVPFYEMFFFKEYQKKIHRYRMGYKSDENFNKAIYRWVSENSLDITLINTKTSARSKVFRLYQDGDTAGIADETLQGRK
jgi:hypothetical protein